MIRELIEQIESEKVAEAAFGYDPYSNRMKSAFFGELELIEKEAGFKDKIIKPVVGFFTGRGGQTAQRAAQPRAPRFRGNTAEYNAAVAPKVGPQGQTTVKFQDPSGRYQHRSYLEIPGLTS